MYFMISAAKGAMAFSGSPVIIATTVAGAVSVGMGLYAGAGKIVESANNQISIEIFKLNPKLEDIEKLVNHLYKTNNQHVLFTELMYVWGKVSDKKSYYNELRRCINNANRRFGEYTYPDNFANMICV